MNDSIVITFSNPIKEVFVEKILEFNFKSKIEKNENNPSDSDCKA